jgi:hypothetical protein
MAHITINDLLQSDDLDRDAMRSIVGGGPTAVWRVQIDQGKASNGGRIVDYPPGLSREGSMPARPQRQIG